MPSCHICCADQMIVGRWYKLVTYPYYTDEPPIDYWAEYSLVSGSNVVLVHDCVYIKSVGDFTISATDKNGATDTKTITAIEMPDVQRTTVTATSVPDMYAKMAEDTIVQLPNGIYDLTVSDSPVIIPKGCILDFGGSTIKVKSTTTYYNHLNLRNDFSGIRNVYFVGDFDEDISYYDQGSIIINCYCGDFQTVENIRFRDMVGFNWRVGTWPFFSEYKPSTSAGRWYDSNNMNGYIDDNGNTVSASHSWCMSDYNVVPESSDLSYGVGLSSMWIPTFVRLYDIAFYDENGNFLSINKNQQYFRKYYYPEGTKYFRLCVHQSVEPMNSSPRDDVCIMRIMVGNSTVKDKYVGCKELLIDNVRYENSTEGGLSMVGANEDTHIRRMLSKNDGTVYSWCFDIEDCWNSACNVMISHCYFGNGSSHFHGAQGIGCVSSVFNEIRCHNNVHFISFINAAIKDLYGTSSVVRGNITLLNSYIKSHNCDILYEFNPIPKEKGLGVFVIFNHAIS